MRRGGKGNGLVMDVPMCSGLSGSLSIALQADIHSVRSFLVGELSIATVIMLLTLVFGALASAFAVGSGDANGEDGSWRQ